MVLGCVRKNGDNCAKTGPPTERQGRDLVVYAETRGHSSAKLVFSPRKLVRQADLRLTANTIFWALLFMRKGGI